LFFVGWLAKGIAWVLFDMHVLKTQYASLTRTMLGIVLWPIGGLIRIWNRIESWLNR
jgi:hypothetical protein